MTKEYGPVTPFAEETLQDKYLAPGESFQESRARIAGALADDDEHFHKFYHALLDQRFLPGGRIQSAVGSPRATTAFNCFVMGTIPDSMKGIMGVVGDAAETLRLGGGVGYDFSTLRPRGSLIKSANTGSSGAVSFMQIPDAMCGTIRSAGNRRGAMMGVLRIDHPDIEEFLDAKTNTTNLTNFNISVAVTDDFMQRVEDNGMFDLTFQGEVVRAIKARPLYDKLMRTTWDWAEPGVLFIDRINDMNNLHYIEDLAATNPCGEQPLPPHGACLLGSFNLTKYIRENINGEDLQYRFDWHQFKSDIPVIVRAMDNVIDETIYPLPEQEAEAKSKRRMGLGVTGLANTLEVLGVPYASPDFMDIAEEMFSVLRNEAYKASIALAEEKGAFPLYDAEEFLESGFIHEWVMNAMPDSIYQGILTHGVRNSHLISYAPTGTISITADNVSGSIEPVFGHEFDRTVIKEHGPEVETVKDWAWNFHGVKGTTAGELSTDQHLSVLALAQKYCDSAVSKTINVGDDVSWEEFKEIYVKAWKAGCKGCTTFRAAGKRYGILNIKEETQDEEATADPAQLELELEDVDDAGAACYYDPQTGKKTCE